MKLTKNEAMVMLKELEEASQEAFDKAVASAGGTYRGLEKWEGPCGDSFCYASCDNADCRREYRKGSTPAEHNKVVEAEAEKAREPFWTMIRKLKLIIGK